MTKFLLIRHCSAEGQEPEAALTEAGLEQAQQLADFLETYSIDRIISSPFTRTIQTITPFALKNNLHIEIDERLMERVLSSENLPDWYDKLQQTFKDKDVKFTGGESSNEAAHRILSLVHELNNKESETIALVTHGNLSSLLLNSFSPSFGFEQWKQLTNPDVYMIETDSNETQYNRIWR
ncbi:histidine phosphatase family protein [Solibacillus sp. MA9]|uniref:Histidine phosphatase family protein n=1 Tax=Solibacillus palustris TaxID=2908203 RepID=A0ABS9UAZ4_9BACL|nr:histidine phosphatase family protein [Solibacillus sp. MA9]MCH7321516.1 histidine phosphatase family protein [Solibacillus sp. MA9]